MLRERYVNWPQGELGLIYNLSCICHSFVIEIIFAFSGIVTISFLGRDRGGK